MLLLDKFLLLFRVNREFKLPGELSSRLLVMVLYKLVPPCQCQLHLWIDSSYMTFQSLSFFSKFWFYLQTDLSNVEARLWGVGSKFYCMIFFHKYQLKLETGHQLSVDFPHEV